MGGLKMPRWKNRGASETEKEKQMTLGQTRIQGGEKTNDTIQGQGLENTMEKTRGIENATMEK